MERGKGHPGMGQMRPQGGRTGAEKTDEEHGGLAVEETGRRDGVQRWLGQSGGASQDMLSTRMMLV